MDDIQITPTYSPEKNRVSGIKIFFGIFLFLVITTAIAVGSYLLGVNSQTSKLKSKDSINPGMTITPTISPSNTPQVTTTITPSASVSVTISPKPNTSVSPVPTPLVKTKIFQSIASLDGFRSSNGTGNATLEIRVGRNENLVTRGFIGFDISDIPTNAKIKEATLKLYQTTIIGNPYSAGGTLQIDHLTYGDSLDPTDYASPAILTNYAAFPTGNSIGWKEVNVTDKLKDDIANARSVSQFRIHFEKETTGSGVSGDFVYFEAKENSQGSGNIPQLIIRYY